MSRMQPKTGLSPVLFTRESDEWATPQPLYDWLNRSFTFTLDPAASDENAKCPEYFTAEEDGLAQSWAGARVFLNPPYSNVGDWVKKAVHEVTTAQATVVLLTAARVDTRWFQDYILGKANEVQFLPGRVQFDRPGKVANSAPFPSVIVVFRPPVQRSFLRTTKGRS